MENLQPCFCCGGQSVCHGDEAPGLPLAGAYVRCTGCELSTTIFDTRELAIAAWHRRPGDLVAPAVADKGMAVKVISVPVDPVDAEAALAALTPMLLADAAFCIEPHSGNFVSNEKRQAIIWKLIHAADAMRSLSLTTGKICVAEKSTSIN